jgi:putative tryptophan/tyrosine transport system substrate-binding protein
MNGQMQRREFITLVGSAAAWPLAARAEQQERMRRIFVLMGTANDAEAQTRAEALRQALQVLGWTMGRNIQIDYSFGSGDVERMRVYAKEAVASGPDLILAQTNPALDATQLAAFLSSSCRFRTRSAEGLSKASLIRRQYHWLHQF